MLVQGLVTYYLKKLYTNTNEHRFNNAYAEFVLQKFIAYIYKEYIYKNQDHFLDNERMHEIIYWP